MKYVIQKSDNRMAKLFDSCSLIRGPRPSWGIPDTHVVRDNRYYKINHARKTDHSDVTLCVRPNKRNKKIRRFLVQTSYAPAWKKSTVHGDQYVIKGDRDGYGE